MNTDLMSLYGAAQTHEALRYALQALELDYTEEGIAARKTLTGILHQRGCANTRLDRYDDLPRNIDVLLFG